MAENGIKRQRKPVHYSTVIRVRTCEVCGQEFSYEIGRGRDRRLCSDFCRGRRRHLTSKTQPLCCVEGCQNPRAMVHPAVCTTHYSRLRRTGTVDKQPWKYRSMQSNGYIKIYNSDHELAVNRSVYEHRQILFDAIGRGPHTCHWCGGSIDWVKGKCVTGSLVPDHINGNKSDNNISNLVPACNTCNGLRGLFMTWVRKHKDDPWLWQMFNTSQRLESA